MLMQLILGSLPGHGQGREGREKIWRGRRKLPSTGCPQPQPWTQLCLPSASISYRRGDGKGLGSADNPRSLIAAALTDKSAQRHLSPGPWTLRTLPSSTHTPACMHMLTCTHTCKHMCMHSCTHVCTQVYVHIATSSLTNEGHPRVCLALCPGRV